MFFLVVTGVLLVVDLKQPKRFLYVLLRPQWQSWLVRGAYIITAYGGGADVVAGGDDVGWTTIGRCAALAGRSLGDFDSGLHRVPVRASQGTRFVAEPAVQYAPVGHAVLGAARRGCLWTSGSGLADSVPHPPCSSLRPPRSLRCALGFSLIALLAECWTVPPTDDSRRAIHMILGKPMGGWFWGVGCRSRPYRPAALARNGTSGAQRLAAVLALAGMGVIEWLWVSVPQRIPLPS